MGHGCPRFSGAKRPPKLPEGKVPGSREGLVRLWGVLDLVGSEARTHGHGQQGQSAERIDDLAKHRDPFLSEGRATALRGLEPGSSRERESGQSGCGEEQVLQT